MNLIVLPFNDWKKGQQQGFRDRENHLLELMRDDERFEKVLVVDRPVTLPEILIRGKSWRTSANNVVLRGPLWQVVEIRPGFHVLDLLDLSIFSQVFLRRNWWARAYAVKRFHYMIAKSVRFLGLEEAPLLLHHPFGVNVLDAVPHKKLIFDVVDNFMKVSHFSRSMAYMSKAYKWLSANANGITGVSELALENLFEGRGQVMANGVTPEFFLNPKSEHNIKKLREASGPTVGYIGTLAKRVSISIIVDMAKSLPDVQFFMIGPVVDGLDFAGLRSMHNITFAGNLPYDVIPSVLRDLDVCLLPHMVEKYQNDGDAIKLYEYIAARKPVIATPILGTEQFRSVINIEEDGVGFVKSFKKIEADGFAVHYPSDVLESHLWKDKLDLLYQEIKKTTDLCTEVWHTECVRPD